MEEIVKHINDTNASFRTLGMGDAKNTDLFLDNEHYELFHDAGDKITVRFNKENLQKAILFIASILPRKFDNAATHRIEPFSTSFVYDQLAFLDAFFTIDGVKVNSRTQIWNPRINIPKKSGEIDKRFYFNGLLEDVGYTNSKGQYKIEKFTIRNYLAGGYSDLHIKKSNDGIFDVWITNTFEYIDDGKERQYEEKVMSLLSASLQIIFYGAPGTGKSHEIKRLTKGRSVIRTTFHPDSDYSTFVGAYKPVMEDVDVQVVPVVLNKSGIGFDENKGTYKERHIEYKFVKQAFLKAYLAAWKKYTEPKILPISFGTGTSGRWFIMSVGPHVSAKKTLMPLKDFEEKIKEIWNNANDNVINEDAWVEKACCDWYRNVFDSSNATEEMEWKDIEEALNAEEGISVTHDGQGYKIKNENGNVVITIDVDKDSIREYFDNKDEESNSNNPLQKSIAGRIRNFSDNFDKAWSGLVKGVNENNVEPQFLIIEEINRGNCAQIFGDIFQLLDRSDNGFSTYPIEADSDIKDEIAKAFREDEEYKLSSDICIEGVVDGYTSNYGKTLSEDVQEGRILLLPPNLFIWATMNTSDQSLFPIDSAFKRRWDWKYMPISNNNYNWIIEIGDKKYKWVDFQKEINNRIYDIDNSEDKQLGDYFVNANRTDNKISSYTLLNKILFYLWNDVCKDEPDLIFSWKDDSDGGKEKSIKFSEFFCDEKERDRKLQGLMSFLNINAIVE